MHFVNVEHTENKLYRHLVCVYAGNTRFIFYFFHLYKAIQKFRFYPEGDVIIMFLFRRVAVFPAGPLSHLRAENMKYDLWKTRRQPQPSYTILPQQRITRTEYIRTAVSLDYEVLIKFSFLISVYHPVAIPGISVL